MSTEDRGGRGHEASDRERQLRQFAGSLAASLRMQQTWGAAPPPVAEAKRLIAALDRGVARAAEARVDRLVAPDGPPAQAPPTPAHDAAPTEEVAEPGASRAPAAEVPESASSAGPSKVPARPAPAPAAGGERPPWATRDRAGRGLGQGSDALQAIRADLGDCERCALGSRRKNLVFGVGNPNARLMFIGEGPGADEDRQGEPFVGPAGQLLTKMIGAMKLRREDVYIANVVKCRPPGNRDPHPDEVSTCRPFLDRQIDAVGPECIVLLGRIAASALLNRSVAITRERGTWTTYRDVPVLLTLHPAYLLRHAPAKREAWADLQSVMKRLEL